MGESIYYPKYFRLYELLPPEVYTIEDMTAKEPYMQKGWALMDSKLLETIDVIRDIVGYPLICNTWYQDGSRRYSGYRTMGCTTGVAKSQHKLGKAVDLICPYMTAEEMRQVIIANKDRLPYPIRIEDGVNWLHIDVKDMDYKGEKIYLFKV